MYNSWNETGIAALILSIAITGGACGEGEPPSISNLHADGTVMILDEMTLLSGEFDFSDPDGDLDLFGVELIAPTGDRGELPRSELTGVGDATTGTINWAMYLTPSVLGTFEYRLFVVDAEEHESNRLSGTFEVEAGAKSAAGQQRNPLDDLRTARIPCDPSDPELARVQVSRAAGDL